MKGRKMEEKKIIEKVLRSTEFESLLRDYLARKISEEYHFRDVEGELIKKEVRKLIVEEAKLAIKELVEDYGELKSVKRLIQEEIRNLTKEEVVRMLVGLKG